MIGVQGIMRIRVISTGREPRQPATTATLAADMRMIRVVVQPMTGTWAESAPQARDRLPVDRHTLRPLQAVAFLAKAQRSYRSHSDGYEPTISPDRKPSG